MNKKLAFVICILMVCLFTGLILTCQQQMSQNILPPPTCNEELMRQIVLEKKIQSLATSIASNSVDRYAFLQNVREINDFIFLTWSNREDRVQALLKMERSLYDIDTMSSVLTQGNVPVWNIYELVGEIMNGVGRMENSKVDIWKMQIRALARLKKDLDLDEKLFAAEPARSKNKSFLKNVKWYTERNLRILMDTYEGHLNTDVELGKLSVEQARDVRAYFEHSFNRPPRTEEQIMKDRELHQPRSPTDDDVRIDVEL